MEPPGGYRGGYLEFVRKFKEEAKKEESEILEELSTNIVERVKRKIIDKNKENWKSYEFGGIFKTIIYIPVSSSLGTMHIDRFIRLTSEATRIAHTKMFKEGFEVTETKTILGGPPLMRESFDVSFEIRVKNEISKRKRDEDNVDTGQKRRYVDKVNLYRPEKSPEQNPPREPISLGWICLEKESFDLQIDQEVVDQPS